MMLVTAPWVQSKVTPGIFELGPVLAQHAHAPQLDQLGKVFIVVKSDHSTQIDSNLLLGNAVFITVKNVSCCYYYNVMVPRSHSGDEQTTSEGRHCAVVQQVGVAVGLGLLAVEAGSRPGGDVAGEALPDKSRRDHMPGGEPPRV